jgi:hypothetical protein
MKTVLNYLAVASTKLFIDLFVIVAQRIKKKLRGDKGTCVEANKS